MCNPGALVLDQVLLAEFLVMGLLDGDTEVMGDAGQQRPDTVDGFDIRGIQKQIDHARNDTTETHRNRDQAGILTIEEAAAGNFFTFHQVLFDPDLALGKGALIQAATYIPAIRRQ